MGEYDATKPHRRGSVIPCSLQTRKKAPYTLSNASYIARALVEMSQAYYEIAIDCSRRTRLDKQVEPSFGLRDPARPQCCVDLVAGKLRIHRICFFGGGPKVGMVRVPVSDTCEPATKMECASAIEKDQAAGDRVRKF
ncbi:MAG TPA: hypothetical protein VNX86_06535 [Rhizomicrobium sp.]|nr:hypothetical protein [Rhizomicrobium sp.]